jgi:hypothetical protein
VAEAAPATFRTTFPLNDTHAAILAAHAPVIHAQGLPAFFAWRKHRYDPLSPHEVVTCPYNTTLIGDVSRHPVRTFAVRTAWRVGDAVCTAFGRSFTIVS